MSKVLLFVIALLLSSLAFPGTPVWFGLLAWISLAPIIYLTEKLPAWSGFWYNWLFFFSLCLTLFWVNPFRDSARLADWRVLVIILILCLLFPLGWSLTLALARLIADGFSPVWRPVIYASCWTAFEYLLTLIPGALPLSLAITQTNLPWLIQLTALTGIFGISFLLILVSAFLAGAFLEKKISLAIIALVIFLANLGFGLFNLSIPQTMGSNLKLGLVQPNVSWQKSQLSANPFFRKVQQQRLLALSKRSVALDKPDLIIWPELAAGYYLLQDDRGLLASFSKELHLPLLTGTLFFDHGTGQPCNIAALINRRGETASLYQKQKLFPFFESSELAAGKNSYPLLFGEKLNGLGFLLCFESLFPQITSDLVDKGAECLILLANDAWFGASRWPWLHSSYLVFRALDCGRWAIHLNNTGPSLVISSRGEIKAVLPAGQAAVAVSTIHLHDHSTLYRLSRGAFPVANLCLALGLAGFYLFQKRR